MILKKKNILALGAVGSFLAAWVAFASPTSNYVSDISDWQEFLASPPDSSRADTSVKGMSDRYGDRISNPGSKSPWDYTPPSNVETEIEMTRDLRTYSVQEKIGDSLNYRPKSEMNFQEFAEYQRDQYIRDYWDKASETKRDSGGSDEDLSFAIKDSKGDPIVEIRPSGNVTLEFGGRWQRTSNPAVPIRQQRTGGFDFDQQISLNLLGNIGDRLNITANWDTKATFDFDNNIKVSYAGKEEDIVQDVQAGNIELPLDNTLITGAQNLFGVKTRLQFGRLGVTTLFSSQRGKTETITIRGGAQTRQFEKDISDYDYKRHFFIGQYFHDNFEMAYEPGCSRPGMPTTGARITRMQVYITNTNNTTTSMKNVLALMDLGEPDTVYNKAAVSLLPNSDTVMDNNANDLWRNVLADTTFRSEQNTANVLSNIGLNQGTDYQVITNARLLDPERGYTFHPELGYISLTTALQNEEALAVAYEYTTSDGSVHQVGELLEDFSGLNDDAIVIMKMLKPSSINTNLPTWRLMMKNIYSLGTSKIDNENFQLRVIYEDDFSGKDNPNLQDGNEAIRDKPLISHLGLDILNQNGDAAPDGNFDFLEGATINSDRGYVIFPSVQPFGESLDATFIELDKANANTLKRKYVYTDLYSTTQVQARQSSNKNKFKISGSYQSAISQDVVRLSGINIAEGSVIVMVGTSKLQEGSDYTVNYDLGQVKFINAGVFASGQDIKITFEKSDLFSFRTKSLVGTRLDYKIAENFNVGGTFLHLNERPLITRVNIGDEPIKNTQVGVDLNYKDDSRLLTKMVDFLPVIQTKAQSNVQAKFEAAALIPGSSRILNDGGTAYLDDFEGAETPYDFTRNPTLWRLSSTPGLITPDFNSDGLDHYYHRAKLSWYTIDRTFYLGSQGEEGFILPAAESGEDNQPINHYVRSIRPQEIFPNQQNATSITLNTNTFDLAYYPAERGPYNYNVNALDLKNDGSFERPEDNWAGITRGITFENDFTKSNIEYIEFWMMNPFHADPNTDNPHINQVLPAGVDGPDVVNEMGGDLYFNLGDISEDVIPDKRRGFENGLPDNVDSTVWGNVTTQLYINNAFDNSGDRESQDVGLDGLRTDAELEHFQSQLSTMSSLPIQGPLVDQFLNDPSSDDFGYFVTDNDNPVGILTRYKDYNGTENNSPINDGSTFFTKSNYNTPDDEDINGDNSRSDNNNYYEYKFSMTPAEVIGKDGLQEWGIDADNNPYIVGNVKEEGITWYQVRIPIKGTGIKVGSISDFTTIKFFRMYMHNFKKPVILRLAQFQLVGSQWRRTEQELGDGELQIIDENRQSNFTFNTVNIEENSEPIIGVNGNAIGSPYVVPPGVIRDFDQTTNVQRQLNEQAIQLCVDELEDGDARAVVKVQNYGDIINYERLKMYIHAETRDDMTEDGEMTAFLRLANDENLNYYEIEVPLNFTVDLESKVEEVVWREDNWIDIPLSVLNDVKRERNAQNKSLNEVFSMPYDRYIISIRGVPNRSETDNWMLGIRNPARLPGSTNDDGEVKTACVWFNELRVTGFNKKAGWATRGSLDAQLADLGSVSLAGQFTSAGYGGIESQLADRTRNNTLAYTASSTIALDKFIPKNKVIGIKLPLYTSIDKEHVIPQYNPLDPDVLYKDALKQVDGVEKAKLKEDAVYDKTIKTINLTGVQLVKVKDNPKKHFYDPHNIVVGASYTKETRSGAGDYGGYGNVLDSYLSQNYKGTANYAYSLSSKGFTPLKKVKFLKGKYLALIKDFNFNPVPSSFSVGGALNRSYVRATYDDSGFGASSNYEKAFTFDRNYSVRWALTKSINLGYTAAANSIIDEPFGDKYGDPTQGEQDNYASTRQEYKDSVNANLVALGRLKNFTQNVNASYKLPLNKIPLLDWINADVSYKAGYRWTATALGQIDKQGELYGNVIGNDNDVSLNGKLNMVKLYNKSKILKKINTPPRKSRGRPKPKPKKEGEDEEEEEKEKRDLKGLKYAGRALMMVRNVNGRFSVKNSLDVPGFLPTPDYLGMENGFGGAPGFKFITGDQNISAFQEEAIRNGWLTESYFQYDPIVQRRSEDLNLKASVEPFKDFRIQLNAVYSQTKTYSENYRVDEETDEFRNFNPVIGGNMNMTYITIGTAFNGDRNDNSNKNFDNYSDYRAIYQSRLNADLDVAEGRYGKNSQDVLIPAFLAAYSGKEVNSVGDISSKSLNKAPSLPLPNWRIDYAGLSRLPKMRKKFSSFSITHSYSSKYNINSFTSALRYDELNPNSRVNTNSAGDLDTNGVGEYVPVFLIDEVTVQERFSPLIGINIRTKSKINIRVDYNKSRTMTLSMNNGQVTEVSSNDFVFGFGYTTKNFKMPFRVKGEQLVLPNNLTFKTDISVRDTKTVQRTLDTEEQEGLNEVTAGNLNFQLRPNINYEYNKRLNIQLFFERSINNPKVSTSFKRTSTRFGIKLRFSLA